MSQVTPHPAVRDLCIRMLAGIEALAQRVAQRIRDEDPYYAEETLVTHKELDAAVRDNLAFILSSLAGLPNVTLDIPRLTARTRAMQGVPYESVLQAFRIGSRSMWEALIDEADSEETKDVLLQSAADVWAVSDSLAFAVTDAYRDAVADRARVDSQVRSALLNTLLDGTADTVRQWDAARLLKLPTQGQFVVVSAECLAPGEEALVQIEGMLRRADVNSAWRVDADRQEGIIVLNRRFEVAELLAAVSSSARSRAGCSAVYGRLDETARALADARLACSAGTPGSRDVVQFDKNPVAVLLTSTPNAAAVLARHVLGRVLDLPDDDRTMLIETARTWLAEAGSTSAAAKRLHMHRNTVRYRLRRIEELTGRNLTNPLDLGEIHLALEAARILALA